MKTNQQCPSSVRVRKYATRLHRRPVAPLARARDDTRKSAASTFAHNNHHSSRVRARTSYLLRCVRAVVSSPLLYRPCLLFGLRILYKYIYIIVFICYIYIYMYILTYINVYRRALFIINEIAML